MTRHLSPADPATAAYLEVAEHIEKLILARMPRIPFKLGPQGLTAIERFELAQMLVDAARVAAKEGPS